jgi:cation diffusion facilitator CzcD-associated flavoprotein CzcO
VSGTGATGIQTITEVAKMPTIESLKVFQRTPSWSAPLRNTESTPVRMQEIKGNYDSKFRQCASTPTGFLHAADPCKSADVPQEERVALWEKLYSEPGFGKWLGAFKDTHTYHEANRLYSDFMAEEIRARVHDPIVAEQLIPKDHGFGLRRVPLENGYFEVYNDPKVHLVNLRETPITVERGRGVLLD